MDNPNKITIVDEDDNFLEEFDNLPDAEMYMTRHEGTYILEDGD